jgi:hypothetical protein
MLVHNRMAKHARRHRKGSRKAHRKGSRKAHRKGSRSAHRKGSRSAHRKSHRKQRGGASCSAMPRNFASFQQGGMAPIAAGDNYLLDAATRVQAEVGPLDKAFADLSSVIPKQLGGRRKSRRSGRKGRRSAHRRHGRKSHRRQQRGGMSPFDAPGMLLDKGAYAADGTNPQFRTEGTVNSLYGEFKGAQA